MHGFLSGKYFPPNLSVFSERNFISRSGRPNPALVPCHEFYAPEDAVSKAKLVVLGLVFGVVLVMANERSPLKLINSVDLPQYSGDFDHFAADLNGNRLFLAAEDHGTLEVFDLKSTKWLQ